MDQLRAMEAFVHVGRASSFKVAAKQLGISRALVSKLVLQLEQSLGVRLLNRTTRTVRLSDIGQSYFEFCARTLADIDEANVALGTARKEPRGSLRILAQRSFGVLQLAPAIGEFTRRYPDIKINLSLSDQFVDLTEHGFDAAVRVGTLPEWQLVARRIHEIPWITCASPAYLRAHKAPKRPNDLASHRCLVHLNVSPDRVWRYVDGDGRDTSVRLDEAHASNSVAALKEMTIAGMGITLMPEYAINGELKRGTLVPLLPRYTTPALPLHVLYPPNRYLAAKVRVFVDFLAERFSGGRWY
jgi:DNA-binding transcriptional LysR family regulator